MSILPNKKILIIEDEPDVVDLLTLQLRKAGGFSVLTAHDGAEGLKKARAESPALIVLDLMLPRMPGLEVCKVLKTDSLNSPHSDHHADREGGGGRSHRRSRVWRR